MTTFLEFGARALMTALWLSAAVVLLPFAAVDKLLTRGGR